jgi:hypothetical protein
MRAMESERANDEAERLIRARYTFLFLFLVPVGLLGGIALFPARIWSSPFRGIEFLLVASVGLALLGLGLGYLCAGAIISLSVPRAITIGAESVVGDFGRKDWRGPPLRERRFEDIRAIRRARLVRVPLIFGHPDYSRRKPIRDSAIFYISEENMKWVQLAILKRSPDERHVSVSFSA